MTPAEGTIEGKAHLYPLRVYYEDTDAGGIVYHASYLRFAERARTEMLRCLYFPHSDLIQRNGVMLVVRGLEIEYVRPARLDDALEVRTRLKAIGGASLKLSQDVGVIGAGDGHICARMLVRLACIDSGGRPMRLPDDFAKAAALLVQT
jgi:acyl-CoA thioester hydrolase